MENSLKQRIVGALVLLALGVLFVPLLFETDGRRALDTASQIPAAPDIQPMVVAAPTRNPAVQPIRSAEQQYQLLPEEATLPRQPQPDTAVERNPVASQPPVTAVAPATPLVAKQPEPDRQVLGDNGMPAAWMVQVASFGAEDRANALRDQLLQDGYTAFTRTFDNNGGKLTRVFVGPKISRDNALEVKESLDKSLKINTLVVSFSP